MHDAESLPAAQLSVIAIDIDKTSSVIVLGDGLAGILRVYTRVLLAAT